VTRTLNSSRKSCIKVAVVPGRRACSACDSPTPSGAEPTRAGSDTGLVAWEAEVMEVAVGQAAMSLERCACLDDSKGARRTLAETMLKARLGKNRNCDLFRRQLVDRDGHVSSPVERKSALVADGEVGLIGENRPRMFRALTAGQRRG